MPINNSNMNQTHIPNPPRCPCGLTSIFTYPPSIPDLLRDFPDIVPDLDVRRDELRCRNCDYRASMNKYQAFWTNVNKYMVGAAKVLRKEYPGSTAMTLRQEGVPVAEGQNAKFWLDHRKQMLKEQANRYTEAGKFLAWIPFWSIWGKSDAHRDIAWPKLPASQPPPAEQLLFDDQPMPDGQQLPSDQVMLGSELGLFDGQFLSNDQSLFTGQPMFDEQLQFDEQFLFDEQLIFDEQPMTTDSG
ncbi:hypothetical protein B0T25DRAFT_552641 [Lasiosphaeria hispida]|uniref:Uncharacterized protein n=1 Tax=Lasiosphaeria hispida TaxID=260671 RepID=A0AAJ0HBR5_9PEZI|nr:hypothetical protein B0T25DRAFT_552641 [Lasiosphaeria hispida]